MPQTPADKAAAMVKSIATAQSEVEYDHDDYLSGLPNATKSARTRHSILADEFRTIDNPGAQTATLDDQDDELGDTSENVWNCETFKKNFIETDEGQWMYNYTTSQLFNEVNDATKQYATNYAKFAPSFPYQSLTKIGKDGITYKGLVDFQEFSKLYATDPEALFIEIKLRFLMNIALADNMLAMHKILISSTHNQKVLLEWGKHLGEQAMNRDTEAFHDAAEQGNNEQIQALMDELKQVQPGIDQAFHEFENCWCMFIISAHPQNSRLSRLCNTRHQPDLTTLLGHVFLVDAY